MRPEAGGTGGLGTTVGIEEEYHLVDPDTFELARRPALVARALSGELGAHLHPEMLTSQFEAVTPVCHTQDDLFRELLRARSSAAAAAAADEALILATSTHPVAGPDEVELMRRPRYEQLEEKLGELLRVNLCGFHVHVGVPDLDTAVAVSDRAREYLPALIALSASSPYYAGRDTRHASFRIPTLELLPQGGVPPLLQTAENFRRTVDGLRAHGLVDDASGVLWGLRPSSRYPTLEFRILDVCPDARDAVLLAGVIRALVCRLGEGADAAPAEFASSGPVLRAACWHAARYALTRDLWSPSRRRVVPAGRVLDELLELVGPELAARGELAAVRAFFGRRVETGGDAERQRRVFARHGSLAAVVRDGVELTARSD